jgi:hypothetical protein
VTRQRVSASLTEALAGEVEAQTIKVEVNGAQEFLTISVSYVVAAIGLSQQHNFSFSSGGE